MEHVSIFAFLLFLSIIIALVHMVAPDHWVPLIAISKKNNYTEFKKYGMASGIAGGHAVISGAIAFLILVLGLTFLKSYTNDLIYLSIFLLLIVGLYFIFNGLHESKEVDRKIENSIIAVSIFPDLAIVPIIVSASVLPFSEIIIIFIGFLIASIISLNIMIYVSSLAIGDKFSSMKPENMDYVIGGLLLITALIVTLFPSF
ncbi:MAG: hypothetical protein ACYDAO_10410 [Thermoplasmataceae archaeon]